MSGGRYLPPPIPDRDMLVEANHRGYIVDHESEEGIKREIDLAADVGAEMFVIDAGWYGPEPNRWAPNVGDWYAGAWLPNDLNPVREYARQKGLLFGLWVEIESIGSASKLRQEHPDWVLTRNGQPVANGRSLDVANPVVAAWMESEIARIIKKYDLDLFRLDYNSTAEEGGNRVRDGFVENTLWRHVDALYAMFDRLREAIPPRDPSELRGRRRQARPGHHAPLSEHRALRLDARSSGLEDSERHDLDSAS